MKRLLIPLAAAAMLAASTGLAATATASAPVALQAADVVYDVADATVVPVQVTGDPANRWNLVVLGDGYTAADMPKFRDQVDEHMNVMWSLEPYKSYRNYINVYAIEIPSAESGVSCDPNLSAPVRNTPLSMKFWSGCSPTGIERLLVMNQTAAKKYAALAPKADQILALANSSLYGGAGGTYATASAGNAMSALISPHELAHSFGKLQDEYDYYSRGVTTGTYTGAEPSSIHHTLQTVDQMAAQQTKWWRWLGEKSESGGTIGAFEGGQYYTKGIWRPSLHSMMKSLGFYMDQVSRERMTVGISGTVKLIEGSTPTDAPVGAASELWINTMHPTYHELSTTWSVNGTEVAKAAGARTVNLRDLKAREGDVVSVKVVDNTEFVRDPALRDSERMTATLSWTVGPKATTKAPAVDPAITLATPNQRAVGADDVLWVDTTHPRDYAFATEWRLNGRLISRDASLDLGKLKLKRGVHTVQVTVKDPNSKNSTPATRSWTVDNRDATVGFTVSDPVSVNRNADGTTNYTVRESFTLKLTATDDQPGHVVSEFRVDGDGWYHYFGWPNDASKPFLFTPTGTNVDDLVYGNLGTGGISVSPFAPRTPGYGTHQIEYRAIDAAGNIAPAQKITVTVLPAADEAPGAIALQNSAFTSCKDDQTRVSVTTKNTSASSATLTITTPYGSGTFKNVPAGKSVTASFATGVPTSENGTATVVAKSSKKGKSVSATYTVPFNRFACS